MNKRAASVLEKTAIEPLRADADEPAGRYASCAVSSITMTYFLRLLVCIAALALANGCGEQQCEATCFDTVTVTIQSSAGAFAEGRYSVTADLDGTPSTATCTLDQTSTICSRDRLSIRRSSPSAITVGIESRRPKHVELTVKLEDAIVATASFDPQYAKSQPICGNTCENATHTVTAR